MSLNFLDVTVLVVDSWRPMHGILSQSDPGSLCDRNSDSRSPGRHSDIVT